MFDAKGNMLKCASKAFQTPRKAEFGNIRYLINDCRAYHIFVQLTSIILAAANYALLIFGGLVTDFSVPSG